MRRLATAVVLAGLVIAAVLGLSNTAFAWALVVVFTACAWEYAEVNRLSAQPWIYALTVAALLAAALGLLVADLGVAWWPGLVVAAAAVWVLASQLPVERRAGAAVTAGFGLAYFLLAVAALVEVHAGDPRLVLVLVAMVGLGDSAAYYVGRSLGQRKLAPELSPNKTWEGAAASTAAALMVAAGWALWQGADLPRWLLVGVAVNLAAQTGDLLQSAFKRQAGVKDSSNLLPGHGGVWDRTDAILLAAPVFARLTAILLR